MTDDIRAKMDNMGMQLEMRIMTASEKGGEYYDGFVEGFKVALASCGLTCIEESMLHDSEEIEKVLSRLNAEFHYAYRVMAFGR